MTDTASNEVIGLLKGVTVFQPLTTRLVNIQLKRKPRGALVIRFKEKQSEGDEQEFSLTHDL